jgi:hypothetical protein
MKLLHESLDVLLNELHERGVDVVRVTRLVHTESGGDAARPPRLTFRVLVTAAIDEHLWAEWRHLVGRAMAEIGPGGVRLPDDLHRRGSRRLEEVRVHIERAGFRVLDGLLTHDTGVLDVLRWPP